ncbi:hypothetical protein L1F30_01975 [Simiduia sp. 21SJ11W-1]|uniref:WD40/YVTN/BNR-like repeat-containing protein n=1 Tax=Simiduia sp. 21SJ11W-1 TaxID=2909669 RepID=UPI0020A0EEA8|nr:hypothetical protein [Simiduia sp. 21SJ11W-1]UTA48323.1 hypothetical protein L1F30_01975 [Simiduia sp. 21SJ11W-1]
MRFLKVVMLLVVGGVLLASCKDDQARIVALDWQYWAPGGGGEIQSIYLDPAVKDRFYVMSDMEGLYRTDDGGKHYSLLAEDLAQLNVFGLASDPTNPDRLYLGTHRMALLSDDAGETWNAIAETLTYPVQLIGVNPNNSSHIVMALSSPDITDLNDQPKQVPEYATGEKHPGLVFVSTDSGKTFTKHYYDQALLKEKNAWDLVFDSVHDLVYLATERGLYHSRDGGKQWAAVAAPEGFSAALGFALSPAGDFAFAIFAKDEKISTVFTTRAKALANGTPTWVQVDQLYQPNRKGEPERLAQPGETRVEFDGETYTNPGQRYARLKVDPRSQSAEFGLANTVRLLMGKTMKHHNSSLFYSTFDVSQGVPSRGNWQRIYYEGGKKGWGTTQGSDNYVQVDSFDFVPIAWGRNNEIILENGHGISLLDITAPGFPKQGAETMLYQTPVTENNGAAPHTTWANRGFVNTYNGDFATSKNYFVAALSDQGLHESWDYGKSWIRDLRPIPQITASKSVEILETDPPIVVLGTGYGYGASDIPMGLYAKALVHHSPKDTWVHLAGGIAEWNGEGSENANGLPSVPEALRVHGHPDAWDYRIWAMAADSQSPGRLFVGFKGRGIYVCDDVGALLRGDGAGFRQLDLGEVELPKTALVAHPLKENTIFYPTASSLYRYQNGQVEKVQTFTGLIEDVHAWQHQGKTLLAVAAQTPADASHNTYVSADEGKTWHTVLDRAAMRKAGVPSFFETPAYPRNDPLMPFMGGFAGLENWLIVPVGSIRNSIGVYALELNLNNLSDVRVTNVAGTGANRHGYTRVNEGEVRWIKGKPWLVHSTRGAGVVAADLSPLLARGAE